MYKCQSLEASQSCLVKSEINLAVNIVIEVIVVWINSRFEREMRSSYSAVVERNISQYIDKQSPTYIYHASPTALDLDENKFSFKMRKEKPPLLRTQFKSSFRNTLHMTS